MFSGSEKTRLKVRYREQGDEIGIIYSDKYGAVKELDVYNEMDEGRINETSSQVISLKRYSLPYFEKKGRKTDDRKIFSVSLRLLQYNIELYETTFVRSCLLPWYTFVGV